MTTKITADNIEQTTLATLSGGPAIANIQIANSSYGLLDDTAVNTAGGYVVINGTKFSNGCSVLIGNTVATTVTFVSATQVRAQVPAKVGASYVVYVTNPDGGTAIAVNGLTYSNTPVWATNSTLTPGAVDEAISINLSAPSDSNVVYSVAAGSSLPSGVSLASNGLLSGTITGISEETTYNFTVDAIDVELQDTSRSFSITIIAGDQYYKNTTLHLNGETASNTWIIDASTNKFPITVAGDTKPVGFSPYETIWSNYFDGAGDDLTIPTNSAFTYGTGDFTIEMWVYITANPGDYAYFYAQGPNTTASMCLYIQSGKFNVWNGSNIIVGSTSYSLNRWYHVALSRSGTSLKLFLNGVEDGSATNSSNITTGSTYGSTIGRWVEIVDNRYFTGYISNARVVKGTALYTANFTPPTSPLTAITNTSLLTCQSNRLRDASTNNFTITRNGDVSVSNFGPFVETDLITGSAFFDGTGDYLNAGTTQLWTPANSFTVESWFYITSFGGNTRGLFAKDAGTSGSSRGISIYVNTNGSVTVFYSSSGSDELSATSVSSGLVTVNQWYYFAFVKNGSSCTLYLNGSSVLSFTSATIACPVSPSNLIGAFTNGSTALNMLGYMSDFRLVSNTAVYTSNFTPPTTPLTAIANTSLLTLQSRIGENNNRFVDTSGLNNIITRNGNTTQGTFSPYQRGGWSGYFTGSSTSYISTPSTTLLNQGQTYTVQCWIYPTSFTTSTSAVRRMYLFVKGVIYAGLSIHSDGTLGWYGWPTPGGMIATSAAGTITTNSWQHVALVVNPGNYIKLFKNGVEVGTASYTAAGADGSAIIIGHGDTGQGTDGFIGYISNFKITQSALTGGQLDYSTTPTISSPTGSSLLTLQTNQFNDTSNYNLSITPAAAASVQPFSPFKTHTITANTLSVFFNGTGDFLSVPVNTAFQFGTGDFTIECWWYPTSLATFQPLIYHTDDSGVAGTGEYVLVYNTTLGMRFYINGGTTTITQGNTTGWSTNLWYHVAAVRNGNTLTIYRNGISIASGSVSGITIGASVLTYIAGEPFDPGYMTGYISNVRIVKGTAVYTSNFTPPTSPLTAIANTSLLTCQSSSIIDNSTNNFAITRNGNARVTTVNPLGFTVTNLSGSSADYSIIDEGGSMYFDGTGDYLATADKVDLRPGTSNFTLEGWIYRDVAGAAHTIYAKGGASTGILLQVTSTNVLRFTHTTTNIDSTITIPAKSWTHVAVVRSGTSTNQTKLYINGVFAAQGTVSTDFTQTEEARVGTNRAAGENFNGYISALRFLKGVDHYTSGFVPPAAPLTPIVGSTLLLNGTNGGVFDYTRKNNLETVGDIKIRNNIVKYGNTSMYFDGTGDYLKASTSDMGNFGTGNFTIEMWVYFNTVSGTHNLIDFRTATNDVALTIALASSAIILYVTGSTRITTSTLSATTWYHIACVRSSGVTKIYINGTQSGSNYTDTNSYVGKANRPLIGELADGTTPLQPLNAYVDDLRITKGVARYTANFTAPTSALLTR